MILVLDDNIDDLELIGHHFKKHGIDNVKLFDNPDLFLKEIDEDVITVVLDHQMGMKTGLEVMKEVIDLNPVCFIIILSGNNDPHIILKYLNNDAFRYVLKSENDYLDQVVFYVRQAQDRINRIIEQLKNG